jgi:TRAP-type C4-dicarboxylate transport system substrate-binding protein
MRRQERPEAFGGPSQREPYDRDTQMTKTTGRQFTTLAAAATMAALLPKMSSSLDQTYTLKIHSFSGPQAPEAVTMVLPFIKAVEAQSGGRLKLEFYPSMQLGGAASDLVEQMEDQVVDIIVGIPGLTPGRFSGLEGMDMPFTNVGTSEGQTAALLSFADKWLMNTEFKGIKILHMHATDAAVFHTIDKPIETLADFKGLKIRAPGRYLGEAIKWGIVTPCKLQEIAKYDLETPVNQNPIMVLMNQDSFDALPADLQAVIEANIGMEKSVGIAKAIDGLTVAAKAEIVAGGGVLYPLTAAEKQNWAAAVTPVYQMWIDEMTSRGLSGQEMFADLMATTATYGRQS